MGCLQAHERILCIILGSVGIVWFIGAVLLLFLETMKVESTGGAQRHPAPVLILALALFATMASFQVALVISAGLRARNGLVAWLFFTPFFFGMNQLCHQLILIFFPFPFLVVFTVIEIMRCSAYLHAENLADSKGCSPEIFRMASGTGDHPASGAAVLNSRSSWEERDECVSDSTFRWFRAFVPVDEGSLHLKKEGADMVVTTILLVGHLVAFPILYCLEWYVAMVAASKADLAYRTGQVSSEVGDDEDVMQSEEKRSEDIASVEERNSTKKREETSGSSVKDSNPLSSTYLD